MNALSVGHITGLIALKQHNNNSSTNDTNNDDSYYLLDKRYGKNHSY